MSKLKIIIIVISLFLIAGIGFYFFGTYSEGDRAGTLVKLSKKGYVFKTYEGELNMVMFVSDQSAASGYTKSLWQFSVVKDDALIKILDDAMLNGYRIKLKYKEKFFAFPWEGETTYFVYQAEVLKN